MKIDYLIEFVGDFFRESAGLSLEEKGLRATLRFLACDQEPVGTLPAEDRELVGLVGIPLKRFLSLKPRALKGWVRHEGRWINEDIRKQYARMVEQKAKRSRAGIAGNAARWHGDEPIALRSECDPNAIRLGSPSSSSSSSSSEQEIRIGVDSSDRGGLNVPQSQNDGIKADEKMKTHPLPLPADAPRTVASLFTYTFWPAYPRKEHKKQALIVFESLGPGLDLLTDIMTHLEADKQYWRETGQSPKLPDNWLKAQEWKHSKTPATKATGLIVSDTLEPEPNEDPRGNGHLNKAGTYPRD